MKKLLGTLFAATLVLSACSQDDTKKDENKKAESTTEKKTDDKKDKKTKEDKKSKEEKKSQENEDNKSTQDDNSTEEQDTQETATNEQVQSQQQTQQANNNQNNEYDNTSGLLNQDQMEANARVAKENGYTGIPNGDIGAAEEMEAYAKQRYEEDKNINDEDVEEFTPEEQQAAMEQHDKELEQEGLK